MKQILLRFLFLTSIIFFASFTEAQNFETNLVQFSGVVVAADSLQIVPFCDILIKNANRGTTSDFNGYFSFVALRGDIIEFNAVGFKKAVFVIPDTISRNRYSLIQAMTNDTIFLAEALIYPWPTVEQFKQAFINSHIPDDDLELARKNMEQQALKERASAMPMTASMNYRYAMDKQTSKLYYIGQLPPNNLLNPLAWAQFIKAWRDGKLKISKQ
jgi:hypothetical protein